MVDAASAGATPLHRGLPEEIAIWEILVRLPPKALLRCRAVCRAWYHATSTHNFLLAHHARQPTLPLLHLYDGDSLDIIHFDPRTGLAAVDHLQPVARLGPDHFRVEASCDGILVLSINTGCFCICNPATREYAPLPQLYGFSLEGMYMHPPTGEYKILVNKYHDSYDEYAYHIFTVGSDQPPRHIVTPDSGRLMYNLPILSHGRLHWHTCQMILVFDTTTETFREMCSPIVSDDADMFDNDGMLGVYRFNDQTTIMDIWVVQDYEGEVWAFKRRVEFSIAEITTQFGEFHNHWTVVVESFDGDVFMLVRFSNWLLQVDINGKLVSSFHREGLFPAERRIKQTLLSHTFFPTLEGYVVNASPFV